MTRIRWPLGLFLVFVLTALPFAIWAAATGSLPYSITPAAVGSVFNTSRNTNTNYSFSTNALTATQTSGTTNVSAFTTGFHTDVKRFFRFTINKATTPSGCAPGVGVASSTEINGSYLGHGGSQSLGIFGDGTTSLNNASGSPPSTSITFTSGDVIDLILDPTAKTIQEIKNGGTPSAAVNIAGLATQTVSPAITTCSANDSITFDGRLLNVGYNGGGVAWDAASTATQFTSITLSPLTFVAGSTSAVGTAKATVSGGSNSPTWSIQTSGTDVSQTNCQNYGSSFTISASSGVVTPAVGNAVQNYPGFCVQAAQNGVVSLTKAFTLVGQAPSPLTVATSPTSTTETCNTSAGTAVASVSTGGGNGNAITYSLTAGTPDFALSSTTPPANVIVGSGGISSSGFACASLPSGGATETVTVQASQP